MGVEKKNNFSLLQYAGLAMQWIVLLVLAVYIGKWVDGRWMNDQPLFIWVLPLIGLAGLMIKLIRDTSKK